jgi:pimeloyl-ACP methyl ester carboxylesterase
MKRYLVFLIAYCLLAGCEEATKTPVNTGEVSNAAGGIQPAFIEQSISLSTGVELKYVERNNGDGIPIIFLHGLSDSWISFETVMLYLPPDIHAYALSQRGHGNSSKAATQYRPQDFAADVAAFMKAKNIEKAVIGGHSMGGVHALQFALAYPQLTAGLVIINSDAKWADNPGFPDFVESVVNMDDGSFDWKYMHEFQSSTLARSIDTVQLNVYVNESLKLPPAVFRQSLQGLSEADFSAELSRVEVPVLLIWGDKDVYCGLPEQEKMVKGFPRARLLVYEGGGHAVHWEQPERFANDVADFVVGVKKA